MAATMLGSLLVSLGLEDGEFRSGLKQAEKELKKSIREIESAGAKLATVGRNLTLGVTLPLAAIGVASFKAASDVAELESAFDATFGNMSGSVRQWAKETGDAMGRSTQEIQESTLAFQQLFSKAFDPAKATEMSKQFAVLTQDLASFKNLSNQVAQEKLFSGLVGESEPLRAVGVLLSETAVKAKAVELGLAGAKDELSEQAKVSARAAIIMEQLSTAQGDVIRTSSSTANQIKAAQAAFDELRVAIGERLLPALTPIISGLTSVINALAGLPGPVQTGIVAIAGIAAAIGPLIAIFGPFFTGLRTFAALATSVAATATTAGAATGGFAAAVSILRVRVVALLATLGPWAAGLAVVATVIYLVTQRTEKLSAAQRAKANETVKAAAADDVAAKAAMSLASANAAQRKEIIASMQASRQRALQALQTAQALRLEAVAALALLSVQAKAAAAAASGAGPGEGVQGRISPSQQRFNRVRQDAEDLQGKLNAADRNIAAAQGAIAGLTKAIADAAAPISLPNVTGATGGGGGGSGGGNTGRSAKETEQRFNDEMTGYDQQSLSARQRMASSADERADLELRSLEIARIRTRESIKSEADYSSAQKDRLLAAVDKAAEEERAAIEFERQMEIERDIADMAQVRFDNQRDLLRNDFDLADTQAERKRIALEILALEQEYRRNQLEMVVNSKTASDAEKARAQAILDSLAQIQGKETAAVSRANETQVERYIRDLNKTPAQINESIDEIKIRGLENLNDQLADAIVNFKSLGDVAKSVIKSILADLIRLQLQKAIIAPLANALGLGATSGASSSIGNGASSFASFFGGARAKGGPVSAGKLYLTSEDGPEIFQAGRSGRIISNKDLGELSSGGGSIAAIVPSPYFDVVVDGRVMRAAPSIASAGAAGGEARVRAAGRRRYA